RASKKVFRTVIIEYRIVLRRIQKMQRIRRFLPAYFFYAAGVQTLMIVAAAFGDKELQLESSKLIITILLIQLVAIFGAFFMSKLSMRLGNIKVLIAVVFVWIGVCVSAFYIKTEIEFYILACLVGLVMGGVQSLSRSTYSKLLPENIKDTTSFFSYYDITEKLAIVLAVFSFVLIEQFSYTIRYSALFLFLIFIFCCGLLFSLLRFNKAMTL